MTQESALPLEATADDDAHSIAIELEAHDVSRFEWRVAVPLPAHESLKYTVQAEFELPSISISSPSPWHQLQGFTRLEEPQRVVCCFMPDLSPRQMIVQAREWCNETTTSRPDPLNPESGATLRVTLVKHVHRGVIAPQSQLAASGVRHVRQLFRYDLTPLCTRLHDPIKSIPVLDAGSGRAKFVGAPRRYQMPIRVLATTLKDRRELNASLILDKQGIVRIEYHASGNS